MYTDLVVDPAAFFDEHELGLRAPLAVVVLTVGVGVFKSLLRALVAESAVESATGAVHISVWTLLTPAIWLSFVALYYVATFHLPVALDEGGEVVETVAVVGWGFVPKLFAVVAMLGIAIPYVGAGAPVVLWGVDAHVLTNGVRGLLVLVALGVSTRIWYHGLRAAHDLDPSQAAFVVGMPVAVALLVDVLFFVSVLTGIL